MERAPDEPQPPVPVARFPLAALLLALGALALLGALLVARSLIAHRGLLRLPPASTSQLVVTPTPDVVLAVRELARLETANYHMERVVEMSDEQTHLFGAVQARDSLLLIAVGEVVAGVDLERLGPGDVRADFVHHAIALRLPAPQVFTAALDNTQTHVFQRRTDTLAERREDLEERARREAESTMRRGAIERGILESARHGAEREVRSLVRAMGFTQVEIEWAEPPGGDALPARD